MPQPKDLKQLPFILGMVNCLDSYRPRLAQITLLMHSVRTVSHFRGPKYTKAFQAARHLVNKAPPLGYYYPTRATVLRV